MCQGSDSQSLRSGNRLRPNIGFVHHNVAICPGRNVQHTSGQGGEVHRQAVAGADQPADQELVAGRVEKSGRDEL
jgi:hypothetical protein